MVSCCEIHQSLADALPSNIYGRRAGIGEKIKSGSVVDSAADDAAVWVDIRFRETNEVMYLVGPQYTHLLPRMYTHSSIWFWCAEIPLAKKKYQSAEWWYHLPFMLDSMPTFILIKAQTATSNNIRRSAKNKFGPGFLFSHVWKTGGLCRQISSRENGMSL